jgi:hypothetical protein
MKHADLKVPLAELTASVQAKMGALPGWPWKKQQTLDYVNWSTKTIPELLERIRLLKEALEGCFAISEVNDTTYCPRCGNCDGHAKDCQVGDALR